MGSTYIEYRGRGFEANDGITELWLSLLVDEIDALSDIPPWLREAREDWEVQAREGFNFGSDPHLDRFVTEQARHDAMATLCRRIFDRFASHGEMLSADQLNEMSHMPRESGHFTRELPTSMFIEFGRQMLDLLKRPESA